MEFQLRDETYAIIGACMEVHKQLGCGFLEKVYQDALEIEFQLRHIPYEREKHITIEYKGRTIDHDYYADFICYDKVIVELKSVAELCTAHKAQVLNYLNAKRLGVGLLVNFGETSLRYVRVANFL